MKATVAVFVLLAAFAYAGKINYAQRYLEQIETVRKECFDQENVHHKHLHSLDDSDKIPPFEDLRCHTLCTVIKFQLIDNELQFLPGAYKNLFDDMEHWGKVQKALYKCLPNDMKLRTCENAYDLQLCIYKNI
ncbi:PREDICTED: uncharacterized protein LOC108567233 [Nicrophorus vespilloides]|uniref:Uncharacterized protein LOC108567233 n=1 Tax=Nicrophorus vespilloides TaxID=110193 RepID=A0ABM1N8A8_NICVS|nr:PREDICTED: uncharacterized protein LOC108567233 [Nicrophorus vespilloides]